MEYDVRVDPPDLVVQADPARLHQLVANLLDNASRHSPTGGLVRVTAAGSRTTTGIEVTDQGPGVAPADRERAFEPFGTLSATEGGGGTGLGLAIARWVTDLHGGSIGFVDPAAGRTGARVRVDLPAAPPVRPDPDRGEAHARTCPGSAVPDRRTARPRWSTTCSARSGRTAAFPAGCPCSSARSGSGCWRRSCCPTGTPASARSWCCWPAVRVIMAASARGADRFTQACAVICVLLAAVTMLRDADWIIVAQHGHRGGRHRVRGDRRPHDAGLRALRDLRAARRPARAALARPHPGRVDRRRQRARPLLRTAVWSAAGLLVFGLLFASADALFAEWADALVPDLELESFVLRAFIGVAVGGVVLAAAYLGAQPAAGRPAGRRRRARSTGRSSGWRRCSWSTRCSRPSWSRRRR